MRGSAWRLALPLLSTAALLRPSASFGLSLQQTSTCTLRGASRSWNNRYHSSSAMAASGGDLPELEVVSIDEDTVQKYAVIQVEGEAVPSDKQTLIRGRKAAEYHKDAAKDTIEMLRSMGLSAKVTGGGRIRHDEKEIYVYGYSMEFGRADHSHTCELLRQKYSGHTVEWSNDGY